MEIIKKSTSCWWHTKERLGNLFINGALSPGHRNSTGQVIHQCWAPTQRREMYFPALTWMLDISKLAQRATHGSGCRVGGLRLFPCLLYERMYAVAEKHSICIVWRDDLFAFSSNRASSRLPVSNVSRWFQPVLGDWGLSLRSGLLHVFSLLF